MIQLILWMDINNYKLGFLIIEKKIENQKKNEERRGKVGKTQIIHTKEIQDHLYKD